jgi:RimJ/RimL family protein N-acetyltransferase
VTDSNEDIEFYTKLFGDPEVMRDYATGETKDRAYVENRIRDSWNKRWKEEKSPYSGMIVIERQSSNPIGHIVMGHGDLPGVSEVAGLGLKEFWGRGYAKEALDALINGFAPKVIEKGYLLEGKPLEKVTATAKPTHEATVKLLQGAGFKEVKREGKFGEERIFFEREITVSNG